jgi:hypothetical protein
MSRLMGDELRDAPAMMVEKKLIRRGNWQYGTRITICVWSSNLQIAEAIHGGW